VFADGTVPAALRLVGSTTWPTGTLQLTYETAGKPTYGNLAVDTDDLQRLAGGDESAWLGVVAVSDELGPRPESTRVSKVHRSRSGHARRRRAQAHDAGG
jgi:hypothetical protein